MSTARKQPPARDTATVVAVSPAKRDELAQRIAALNDLTAPQLREEWRRLYRGQPPRLSRDLLIRSIAYRLQEIAYGGLSKATQRKLDALTRELGRKGSIAVTPDLSLRPGARLAREWRGRTHRDWMTIVIAIIALAQFQTAAQPHRPYGR